MGRLWGFALVIALVSTARADDKAKKQAGELVKQAIAKSQAGDHAAAIDLYQQAYMLVPQPLLLSNIGSEYQKSGKSVEAIKNFCKYIADDPTGANVEYATAQVKTLQAELKNDVDDKDPCKAKPKPVEAEKPIEQPPPPPPPPPPAPSRTLEFTGYGIAAAGAIAFGVGVYYGLQAKNASDTITNHPMGTPWPDNIKQIESDGKSDQTKQIVFMVGGGIALAGGVVLGIYGHTHNGSSAERVSIAPVASPTSVGLVVGGGF